MTLTGHGEFYTAFKNATMSVTIRRCSSQISLKISRADPDAMRKCQKGRELDTCELRRSERVVWKATPKFEVCGILPSCSH